MQRDRLRIIGAQHELARANRGGLALVVQRQAPTVVFQAVFACYRLEIAFAECGANIRQAHVLGGLGR